MAEHFYWLDKENCYVICGIFNNKDLARQAVNLLNSSTESSEHKHGETVYHLGKYNFGMTVDLPGLHSGEMIKKEKVYVLSQGFGYWCYPSLDEAKKFVDEKKSNVCIIELEVNRVYPYAEKRPEIVWKL